MNIETFDQLLAAARAQPTPQRLLMVFAGAELSADASPAQRAAFEAGVGGELTPLMCVDKSPAELASFAALCEEARRIGPPWQLVFAAALSGRPGQLLDEQAAEAPLQQMVEAVRTGRLAGLIPFDTQGNAVQLT